MQTSKEIDGVKTEIIIQSFADRVLVLVTQLGKVGSLIQATMPATTPLRPPASDALPEPPAAIQLTPLMGSAPSEHLDTLHSLYASHIATIVWAHDMNESGGDRRGVIIGLALKKMPGNEGTDLLSEKERSTFKTVMQTITDLLRP